MTTRKASISRGFTILELMMALAIITIVSYGLVAVMEGQNKSQARTSDSASIDSLFSMVKFVLASEKNCSASFYGRNASELLSVANGDILQRFSFEVRNPAINPSDPATTLYSFQAGEPPPESNLGPSLAGYRVARSNFIKTSPNESLRVDFTGGLVENATRVRGRLEVQLAKVIEKSDGTIEKGVHSRIYQIPLSLFVRDAGSEIRKCTSDATSVEEACRTLGGEWDGTTPNLPTELRCVPQRSCIELGTFSLGVTIAQGGFINQYTRDQNCPYDGTTLDPSGIGPFAVPYNGSGVVKWYRAGSLAVMSSQGAGKTTEVSAFSHPVISCRRCPRDIETQALLTRPPILQQSGNEDGVVSPVAPSAPGVIRPGTGQLEP
jgi:prepilin-type N-terminal cleavage/methylation domain-containing protein